MSIELDTASLVALLLEAILFGLLAALVTVAIYLLVVNRHVRPLQKSIVVVTLTMLLLGFIHLCVDMQRILNAFIGAKEDPMVYLNALSNPSYVLKNTVYVLQTLLGDGFVIYRFFIVWNYNKRLVAFPLLCLLASCVVGIHVVVQMAKLGPSTPIFELKRWISTFFSLTLFTNITCTTLIAYKIWSTMRNTRKHLSTNKEYDKVNSALAVVLESGVIYSASLISLLVTFLSGSWSQYIVIDAVVQIIGIVFTLVIVRMALGLSSEKATQARHQSLQTQFIVNEQGACVTPVEMSLATRNTWRSSRGLGGAIGVLTTTNNKSDIETAFALGL